ncbi:hypothetical protein ABID26_003850 [Mesorhizobium shonense]|uniref:Uncharacterized protein n=1 Tax=Mesorhizobium shonense TaxID=1209948 RepID=A0ABV2HWH2_9HYPH
MLVDSELDHLPPELRWREWMGRVDGDLCGKRAGAARGAGACRRQKLQTRADQDIRAELAGRPYELVSVAGGWQHRTKKAFGDHHPLCIGAAAGEGTKSFRRRRRLS